MKKTILFTLAGSLLGLTSVMATNYDLYINGSTAFRKNAFLACSNLYDAGSWSSNNGGGATNAQPQDARWTMSGTMVTQGLTSGSDTMTIHATWNGSVQGISSLANKDQIVFLKTAVAGDTALKTNTASACLSDVKSAPTLYPLSSGSFTEKDVCVQPFVFVKSKAPGAVSAVTNITWQHLQTWLANGVVPGSFLTGRAQDATTNIYLIHRTLDSGTRVTTVQEAAYIGSINVNYYDEVGNTGYALATTNLTGSPAQFGPGYVGGGDVQRILKISNVANQGIAYLSIGDAQGIGTNNWEYVLGFNGRYPTLSMGAGGRVLTGAGYTNDYAPIIYGNYSFWAFEKLDWPKTGQWGTYTDQNITFSQLNAIMNKLSGTGAGSIDQEVLNTQAAGNATAIRLTDMKVSRQAVGGAIAP